MDKIIKRIEHGLPTLVAEIGVNYYDVASKYGISPIDAAKMMIRDAAAAGVHAVKFQSYKANTLAAEDSPSYWDLKENPVTSQRQLFSMFDSFGPDEYAELSKESTGCGVEFMSTAFDFDSADYLYDMMNVYKISSSDLTNLPFIRYQAKKGKPCILSTGAGSLDEVKKAVSVVREVNDCPITLMHCVLEYPTPFKDAGLGCITTLKHEFGRCYIGYSDHTKPTDDCRVIRTAFALGARIVEKHFTMDKTLCGNDHFHSMDANDVRAILLAMNDTDAMVGDGRVEWKKGEDQARRNARRSMVTVRRMSKGEVLNRSDVTFKRPGTGIPPYDDSVFGRVLKTGIPEDTVITYDALS